MKTTKTNVMRKGLRLLVILMLIINYSCDNDENDTTNMLENTSWYLTGYEDSEGNFTPVVYPDDCDDNSCFTLRFTKEAVLGTLDNYNPDVKDYWFGTYIAHSDNRFEFVEQPNIETVANSGRYSKNGEEYAGKMYLINKFNIDNDTLKLHGYDFFALIFSKDRVL